MTTKFSLDKVTQILRNMGHDVDCGACMSVAFTGIATGNHTCEGAWRDAPLQEDAAIAAAFPTRTGRHDIYAEAMRLVGAKHSKNALVALVNWLLSRIAELEGELETNQRKSEERGRQLMKWKQRLSARTKRIDGHHEQGPLDEMVDDAFDLLEARIAELEEKLDALKKREKISELLDEFMEGKIT